MNIVCAVTGHKSPTFEGQAAYGTLVEAGTDGIGRKHGYAKAVCARCGEEFIVIKVHLPRHKDEKLPGVAR